MLEHEVRRYTRDILRGLDHIHSHGVAHCDIKLDNILLVPGKDAGFMAKIVARGDKCLHERHGLLNVTGVGEGQVADISC